MFVIGALIWVVILIAYLGIFGTLTGLWSRHCRGEKSLSGTDRLITAVLVGFLAAPAGCAVLYVPLVGPDDTVIKPRVIDSLSYSYVIALAVISVGVLVAMTVRRRLEGSN